MPLSRSLAGVVTAAVLSAGLVSVSAPASTAAPSRACQEARADVKSSSAQAATANRRVVAAKNNIRRINRKLATLGDSPRDRRERASLKAQRADSRAARDRYAEERARHRHDAAEARSRVDRFC